MNRKPIRNTLTLSARILLAALLVTPLANPSLAQEIRYDDRIGSNKDFDMCEDYRFKHITKLVKQKKISQQQGYNIWKRVQSDKQAVKNLLRQAVTANELTQDQADRLLPLVDLEMVYFDTRNGRFGQPKTLAKGQFKPGEVTVKNRDLVHKRLIAANQRGEMYDFDVASIMLQLYAGFDPETAPVEQVALYRGALNPRIAQSGSQARVLQNARMQRARTSNNPYRSPEIKIAKPSEWIKNLEKPIYSGPQPGEKVPSLTAINLRGDQAGKEFDPLAKAGDKLHLMVFASNARTFGRFLGQLSKQLESVEKNSKQPWAMSIIVCNDDANEVEKSFSVLDQRYPKNLVVGLCKDGAAGPPAYGLDKNLTATVIVVREGKVVHNLPYAGNAFYTQPHILGAIASAMKIDHDTLRKHIAGTAGDAASAAYGRGRGKTPANQKGTPPKGFREKLAPLVLDETLTREESAQLFKVSGDAAALRSKLGELLKSGKLTRQQAGLLLSRDASEGDPNRDKRER